MLAPLLMKRNGMRNTLLVGLGFALFGTTPALAQETGSAAHSLSVTTGVDYSSGDYGLDDDTKITVVPIVGRLTTGDFSFTASLPYIRLNTPGGVVLGPDGKPLPGVPTTGGKSNGFGDVTIGAKYSVPTEALAGLDLSVGGRVKLPTSSDSKGLSTGKTDFVSTVELGYTFGAVSPFVEVGYRVLGDPDGVNLRNGPTLSAGSSVQVGKTVLIASYDYARSATPAADDSSELFGGVAIPAGRRFTVTGYGTKGLSEGSADYGVGLLLTAKVF